MNFSLAEEIERRNRALGKKQNKMGMKFNNIIVHPPQCCYGGQTEATGIGRRNFSAGRPALARKSDASLPIYFNCAASSPGAAASAIGRFKFVWV